MQDIEEKSIINEDNKLDYIKAAIKNIEKNTFTINILSLNLAASTQEEDLSSMASKIRKLTIDNKHNIATIREFLNQNCSISHQKNSEINKIKELIKNSK